MAVDFKHEVLRKLIHLSSFWIVALIWWFPKIWSILILGFVTIFVLVAEYETYKQSDSICAHIYKALFGRILRDNEKEESFHYSGAPYVLIAALILVVVFPRSVAMFALTVLLISDSMAALVGRSLGRHPLVGHKTWEGTSAFIFSGLLVSGIFYVYAALPLPLMCMGVVLGALGDLYNEKLHVDDNLSIPLLTALPFLF